MAGEWAKMTPEQKARMREARKRWYAKNREKRAAYMKQWRAEHPGYGDEWYRQHPEKLRAKYRVKYAKSIGKLKPQPCVCGSEAVEAHHHDYSKPLDVVWMCHPCHQAEHGVR